VSTSSRFATAVHLLAYLTIRGEGAAVASDRIALSLNTNPAVVRRLLMQLSAAGLTKSQLGTGGGAMLARPARSITMLDIRRAVEDLEVFALHRTPPNPKCLVGRNITAVLEEVAAQAEDAVRAVLAKRSLADIADAVLSRDNVRSKRSA
jgi:Rrf2 family protein